jgi:hypothetical protein
LNNFDLHNHSIASDGTSTARELLTLALRNGCDAIALTDHDTIAGLPAADAVASELGLRFIPGVEISVSWAADVDSASSTLHVVGVGIAADNAVLKGGLNTIREGREARAKRIGDDLASAGIEGMCERALALADNKSMVGRTHFARALVEAGRVKGVGQAFQRYLTPGKPGYVAHRWADMQNAIDWIRAAGGVAILAHPGRYKLSRTQMAALLGEFKDRGGEAIEVITGSHEPRQYREYAAYARQFGFSASRGADFHALGESRFEPGTLPLLPDDLVPVWSRLQ